MDKESKQGRFLGFWGATGIGVGAIVGGGILALAGVAFATTGPGAIIAFALNGLIALLTVMSFAELSSTFPESGGTYTFAKKVLSVQTAFAVGWIVWFASIIAAVLYALGFASYGLLAIKHLWQAFRGTTPAWLANPCLPTILAVAATAFYTLSLSLKNKTGIQWATVGKLVVFGVLIVTGFWVVANKPLATRVPALTPLFPNGANGLFVAMGYTFIALQGFDLIAAAAGEIQSPEKNIPLAMMSSLGIALAIYLPLLFIIATVGIKPGESIATISAKQPETLFAVAAQNYLGPTGFWLVIVAAILSMLSALRANLFAASRVALTMGRDRTLPHKLSHLNKQHEIPTNAIITSAAAVLIILFVIPDLASAGAAASLIFLISFALVHGMSILARKRAGNRQPPFKAPLFPLVPVLGFFACSILAVSQGIAVPSAGLITVGWLSIGGVLFLSLFAQRAHVADAAAEARDPHLVRMRGRSPLILVPIANPKNAEAMVTVANALATPDVGRVLLLSVVPTTKSNEWAPGKSTPKPLTDAQKVLQQSLVTSLYSGMYPEALVTMAKRPWSEISRVASIHRCESLLLGLSSLKEKFMETHLEKLMSDVDCDVIVLRAPKDWHINNTRKILVPLGGRGGHDTLRARLLTSLCRTKEREVTFLRIVPKHTSLKNCQKAEHELWRVAEDEVTGCSPNAELIRSDIVIDELIQKAKENDLVVLGLQRSGPRQKFFGDVALKVARETDMAIIMISRRG